MQRGEPREDGSVEAAKAERYAEIDVRTADVDASNGGPVIPGVTPAVAVRIVEVVGLPSVRRDDDRDPTGPEAPRPNNERRVANAAVSCGDSDEVEAARPVPDPEGESSGRAAMVRPEQIGRRGYRPGGRSRGLGAG